MQTTQCIILFSDVTSSRGAVMSCVTSQRRMCTSHVTFCYKRSVDASFEALGSWPLVRLFVMITLVTRVWLVSNACRS